MPATLCDLHADGSSFIAFCSNWRGGCSHRGEVSIDSLIQHLGWDFPYIERRSDLLDILVCTKCGANRPEIQLGDSHQIGAGQGGHSLSPTGVSAPDGVPTTTMAEHLEWSRKFRADHPEPPIKCGGKRRRRFR
jgi:hypothetical protein